MQHILSLALLDDCRDYVFVLLINSGKPDRLLLYSGELSDGVLLDLTESLDAGRVVTYEGASDECYCIHFDVPCKCRVATLCFLVIWTTSSSVIILCSYVVDLHIEDRLIRL